MGQMELNTYELLPLSNERIFEIKTPFFFFFSLFICFACKFLGGLLSSLLF